MQRPDPNPKLRYNNRSLLRMPWRACQYSFTFGESSLCINSMAESEGFEPSVRYQRNTRFPVVLLKPLGQLSATLRSLPFQLSTVKKFF